MGRDTIIDSKDLQFIHYLDSKFAKDEPMEFESDFKE